MPDLYEGGGIPAVQAELAKADLLDLDVPTVTGRPWARTSRGAHIMNDKAIRSIDNPYSKTGGLQILWATSPRTAAWSSAAPLRPECGSTAARPRV